MRLIVPREALPARSDEREESLRAYFAQLLVRATECPEGWCLELEWPSDAAMYVDPDLQAGLEWWTQRYGPVSLQTIPTTTSQQDRFLLAVEDAWTLYGWSRWVESCADLLPSVTVLHIDDHNDFMSPRVIVGSDAWIDTITREPVDLRRPASVAAAIRSGAIGIGSFIAPFVHAMPRVDVRHLCARAYALANPPPYSLAASFERDSLLAVGERRLALAREATSVGKSPGEHRYRVTNELDNWLADIAPGPVLLHVDMDYFNNRYDGDSEWAAKPERHDPPLPRVLERIDELFDALRSRDLTSRLVDVVVALSPGFFPADLWPPTIERLTERLND